MDIFTQHINFKSFVCLFLFLKKRCLWSIKQSAKRQKTTETENNQNFIQQISPSITFHFGNHGDGRHWLRMS